jgi:hypothetical protein
MTNTMLCRFVLTSCNSSVSFFGCELPFSLSALYRVVTLLFKERKDAVRNRPHWIASPGTNVLHKDLLVPVQFLYLTMSC